MYIRGGGKLYRLWGYVVKILIEPRLEEVNIEIVGEASSREYVLEKMTKWFVPVYLTWWLRPKLVECNLSEHFAIKIAIENRKACNNL